MYYMVPNMKLIPQDKNMSCWYASGEMIIEWRREQTKMCETAHPLPGQVEAWKTLYNDNTGISNDKILKYASALGLRAVPPLYQAPDPEPIPDHLAPF